VTTPARHFPETERAQLLNKPHQDERTQGAKTLKKPNVVPCVFRGTLISANLQNNPPKSGIVVSNEVGFGVVPPSLMGRRFRDIQGRANQIAASYADNVALIVAGLPLWIKGGL